MNLYFEMVKKTSCTLRCAVIPKSVKNKHLQVEYVLKAFSIFFLQIGHCRRASVQSMQQQIWPQGMNTTSASLSKQTYKDIINKCFNISK